MKIEGKRFLVGEVPLTPLPGCDLGACKCVYLHHDDRRDKDVDRRHPGSMQTMLHGQNGEPENRVRRGRREKDKDAFTLEQPPGVAGAQY